MNVKPVPTMTDNVSKSKLSMTGRGPTNSGPADFPLGSIESRAAARSMLVRKTHISEEDLDALILYSGGRWLTARMTPDYHDMEGLGIYKRGEELHEARFGKIIPAHEDPAFQRSTAASLAFQIAFGREPDPGDVLRYTDVEARHRENVDDMVLFVDVWNRRLSNLPCPFRVEGNKLFCRTKPGRRGEEPYWEEDYRTAEYGWWRIECEALGVYAGASPSEDYRPTLSCIEFAGVVDGKHQCGPKMTANDNQEDSIHNE